MDDEPVYKIAFSPPLAEKIPAGSPVWQRFNGSFTNVEVLSAEAAGRLYDGQAFTTWHKDHWRTSANFLLGQHIGIDFDTEDRRSSLSALTVDPFIAKYAAMAYTTPSHTPEKPRARVVFLLDTPIYQPKNYTLAVSALLWIFGAADRQCKDPVRFFYGGKPGTCEMEWLGGVLTLASVKHLIAQYQTSGAVAHKTMSRPTASTPDQAEIAAALQLIPPWGIDYDQWLAVLMAIHSAHPDANGLALAESWADGKPGEVAAKWKSFKPTGNGAGAVTVATLFGIAKEYGYGRKI